MNKVFFAGDIKLNNGPSNVNKELYKFLKDDYFFAKSNNKLFNYILYIYYTLKCDVIIFSGLLKIDGICIKIAKVFNKKIIYLMHGCVQYEQGEINKTSTLGGDILENKLFEFSDIILCVSKPFSDWFKQYKPQYSNKVEVLTNGIPWDSLSSYSVVPLKQNAKENKIILLGGGRLTKANLNVVKAVCCLNEEIEEKWSIDIFGYKRPDDDSLKIEQFPYVNFRGMVSHEQLMQEFSSAKLFVQNSIFEPFSLACIEAISHYCSILISRYVGCGSVMQLLEMDKINDPSDLKEIAMKIKKFQSVTNYDRLLTGIDRTQTSCEKSAEILRSFVEKVSKEI